MEGKERTENDNFVGAQGVLHKLKENKGGLHISRIPIKTKEAFAELANAEFCGDYGMCLKFLMDDIISSDQRITNNTLADHEQRLTNVEENMISKDDEEVNEDKTTRKMLDGSKRKIR